MSHGTPPPPQWFENGEPDFSTFGERGVVQGSFRAETCMFVVEMSLACDGWRSPIAQLTVAWLGTLPGIKKSVSWKDDRPPRVLVRRTTYVRTQLTHYSPHRSLQRTPCQPQPLSTRRAPPVLQSLAPPQPRHAGYAGEDGEKRAAR